MRDIRAGAPLDRGMTAVTQLSAEQVLSCGSGCADDAEAWLRGLLEAWDIPMASSSRLLAGAQDRLSGHGELVMFVQYDTSLLLLTLELWQAGRTVYGIDDWLG